MADVSQSLSIKERLFTSTPADRLVVSPMLVSEVSGTSIDLHLGTKFILTSKSHYERADPIEIDQNTVNRFLHRHWAKVGEPVVLHPQMFMLASTLEFVGLPLDANGLVNGRSSYGRLGVLTVTAPFVHAGYKGCLTLELFNGGDSAVILTPGLRLAHLTLVLSGGDPSDIIESDKYQFATEPEFPKLWSDSDRIWLQSARKRYEDRYMNWNH